jgi:hypothetical protein
LDGERLLGLRNFKVIDCKHKTVMIELPDYEYATLRQC